MRMLLFLSLIPAMTQAVEIPFSFEKNQGQAAEDVGYVARGKGYELLLKDSEAVLTLPEAGRALRMSLHGGAQPKALAALNPLRHTTNYFVGREQSQFSRNVRNFARVQFRADRVQILPTGELAMQLGKHRLTHKAPVAF